MEASAQGGKPKQRINLVMAVFMVGAAFLVDGLQFFFDLLAVGATATVIGTPVSIALAIASSFLGIAAEICFWIWFKLLGVEYSKQNGLLKMLIMGAMGAITIIPELDILPEMTLGVVGIIAITRFEDSLNNPKFLKKVGRAAKIVGMVQPELQVATQVIEQQAKDRARMLEQQRRADKQAAEQAAMQPANDAGEEEYREAA